MILLPLQLLLYTYCLWLGCYLLGRNGADRRLRYAGLGLIGYAAAIAGLVLAPEAPFSRPLLYLPSVFWLGATLALIPVDETNTNWLSPLLDYMLPFVAIIIYLLGWGAEMIGQGRWFVANLVIIALLGSALAAVWLWRQTDQPEGVERQVRLWTLIVTLFFVVGAGGLILPLQIPWLAPVWVLLALSLDLEILGLVIVWLDAYEQGELMRRDVLRSMIYTWAAVFFFGGQVALAMWWQGISSPLLILLLTVITTAIITQTFGDRLATLLDRVIFLQSPQLQEARAQLRAAETAVVRRADTAEIQEWDDATFTRLTRRALSHMGDLPKLAASPLTQLPLITRQLSQDDQWDAGGETLARAAILRGLLEESIGRLRPSGPFATTDGWRFYNAVYFPYVVGLKPYSRRTIRDGLTAEEKTVLTWFQQQVPERTLYNWQKKAAALIAQDLREQL